MLLSWDATAKYPRKKPFKSFCVHNRTGYWYKGRHKKTLAFGDVPSHAHKTGDQLINIQKPSRISVQNVKQLGTLVKDRILTTQECCALVNMQTHRCLLEHLNWANKTDQGLNGLTCQCQLSLARQWTNRVPTTLRIGPWSLRQFGQRCKVFSTCLNAFDLWSVYEKVKALAQSNPILKGSCPWPDWGEVGKEASHIVWTHRTMLRLRRNKGYQLVCW